MPKKPRPPIIPGSSDTNDAVDCDQLRQDIDRAQAIVDSLNGALASADPGQKAKIASDLAVAASVLEATWANYSRHCLHAPIPQRPFQTSPWELISPAGIDMGNDVWHTGSIWAVCPLANDKVLMAAETGGLWLSEPTNTGQYASRCLSDSWPHANFRYCLPDPAHPDRVFVRCERGVNAPAGIYVGHPLASYPDWAFVPLPEAISPSAPAPASHAGGGGVSMIIIPGQRLLVAAAEKGIGLDSDRRVPVHLADRPDRRTRSGQSPGHRLRLHQRRDHDRHSEAAITAYRSDHRCHVHLQSDPSERDRLEAERQRHCVLPSANRIVQDAPSRRLLPRQSRAGRVGQSLRPSLR